ncbi:PhnA domain-containing protein [Promicromonospora sukumoe]|uniref:PhnA domain-containing protein n=1 Tax=Promicromonospora sukumoe TaxID=88382 RepID=UPI0037CC594E
MAIRTWNPEIRARRIPGPSAFAVVRVQVLSALGSAAGVVFFFVVVAYTEIIGGSEVIAEAVAITLAALSGTAAVLSGSCECYLAYGLRAAESRAGYTTVFGKSMRLPHVDPRSDRVIRLAGEPALSPDEHRRRLALARESARRDREVRRIGGASRTVAPTPETEDWAAAIRDADGTPLADGDTVIVLKRLSGKGSSAVVPVGTRLRNIRLRHEADDDRLVGAVARGAGPVRLCPGAVRKA